MANATGTAAKRCPECSGSGTVEPQGLDAQIMAETQRQQEIRKRFEEIKAENDKTLEILANLEKKNRVAGPEPSPGDVQ